MLKAFFTLSKALITASGLVKSLGMCSWLAELSVSFTERAAMPTLKPFEAKNWTTVWPMLGPAPRMRAIGGVG
jgi:hypothetical protein